MDPDANLTEQRELGGQIIARLRAIADTLEVLPRNVQQLVAEAERLAELQESLDEWLSKGGFLPGPWRTALLIPPRDDE